MTRGERTHDRRRPRVGIALAVGLIGLIGLIGLGGCRKSGEMASAPEYAGVDAVRQMDDMESDDDLQSALALLEKNENAFGELGYAIGPWRGPSSRPEAANEATGGRAGPAARPAGPSGAESVTTDDGAEMDATAQPEPEPEPEPRDMAEISAGADEAPSPGGVVMTEGRTLRRDKKLAEAETSALDCTMLCDLTAATCALETRICAMTERHPDDPRYVNACSRAAEDCVHATEIAAAHCACGTP